MAAIIFRPCMKWPMCDDARDLTCELAAGCKDERLGSELAKADARQTVEREGSRLAGTRL